MLVNELQVLTFVIKHTQELSVTAIVDRHTVVVLVVRHFNQVEIFHAHKSVLFGYRSTLLVEKIFT